MNEPAVRKVEHENPGSFNATVTVAADAENFWVLDRVDYSYDGAPTGGKLSVKINAVTVWEVDIVAAGPGTFDFANTPIHSPLYTKNESLQVVLNDGGTTNQKVSVFYR